jgi:hypothetical protein
MNRHRFQLQDRTEIERYRLPQPQAKVTTPESFMACPAFLFQGLTAEQRSIYQWAYEQARAVVRPSLLERDLLAVWN